MLAHLEIDIFRLLDLSIDSINLELVGMHLCLVVFQLSTHLLELSSTFLEIILVQAELLCHVRTTLLGEDILKFNVKLFFLLNKDVFLRDFLGLGNQALLQRLNLLNKLISLDISRFELSPSVNIEGFLKLIREVLSLLLLF